MVDRTLVIRSLKLLLLTGLVAYVVLRGVVLGFTAITDDFPEYFTSAKSVRDGQDAVKLYDGDWFRAQTHRYKVGSQEIPGEFTPYPPPTALLLLPLTGFKPLTALRIDIALNVVWLSCSMLLLSRIFAWRLLDSALFILLSGWAVRNGLRLGHPYIVISTFCLLGYYLYLKRRPWLAGLCFGVFAPIKYFPMIVIAGFALHRHWRVFLGGVIAVGAVGLVSIGVLGWKVHEVFLLDVLLNHLTGHLVPGPRFTAIFQSFDTLFERLFILDRARNPHPWISAPQAVTTAIVSTKLLLVLTAAAALMRLVRARDGRAIEPTIGILGILVLLIAPGSGSYALVLLWLPVALLINYFLCEDARAPAYLILCAYALIGFIPYGFAYRFEGDGGLTVLAFPRLLLLLVMFIVSINGVVCPRTSWQRAATLNRAA
jgi:Glycosyltransferase family 87